jgi:hypothetical protein
MVMSPAGLGPKNDSAGMSQYSCTDKSQTHRLIRNGAPREENCKGVKMFSIEVKEKLVVGPGL